MAGTVATGTVWAGVTTAAGGRGPVIAGAAAEASEVGINPLMPGGLLDKCRPVLQCGSYGCFGSFEKPISDGRSP